MKFCVKMCPGALDSRARGVVVVRAVRHHLLTLGVPLVHEF